MILSDRDIRDSITKGDIGIAPLRAELIQPASIDLTLSGGFIVFRNTQLPMIRADSPSNEITEHVAVAPGDDFILHPGEFVLGATAETITLPDYIAARLEGKSSHGRIGLMIHSTAGYVDPGWHGQLTLELSNAARLPIALTPGMKIGQISFLRMTSPCERPYGSPGLGSHYQGQQGPTTSQTGAQEA